MDAREAARSPGTGVQMAVSFPEGAGNQVCFSGGAKNPCPEPLSPLVTPLAETQTLRCQGSFPGDVFPLHDSGKTPGHQRENEGKNGEEVCRRAERLEARQTASLALAYV